MGQAISRNSVVNLVHYLFTSTVRTMYIYAEEDVSKIQNLALKSQNESTV
jgi:hypothetical protein